MSSSEFEANVLLFCIDPEIREMVKQSLEPWMFQKDHYRAMFEVISKDDFDAKKLDKTIVKIGIEAGAKKFQKEDYAAIDNLFESFEGITDDDRGYVVKVITSFIKDRLLWKGADLMSRNKLEQAEPLLAKAINFSIQTRRFTNLADKEKILELFDNKYPKDGKYIKSTLSLINTNSSFKGYRRGDLVQICAKPKCGKTTLMTQEATAFAEQGYHVVFASIGDNEQDDVVTKVCSFAKKVNMSDVINNMADNIDRNADILARIDAESYPSGTVSIGELLADCAAVHKENPIDVLFVDYDANIMQAHESMYESGGIIYSALKAFAQIHNCVVIVGSQPVKGVWELEVLEADAANESSKKAHHVDIMITLGQNPDCASIGTANLALMRRGQGQKQKRIKFNFIHAEIKEIEYDEYKRILDDRSRKKLDEELEGLTHEGE